MLRDLTMIFAVLISVTSVGFGVYKNIEAGNARGFAYEQAYRILGAVQKADIADGAKASIVDAALGSFATPAPVIDLSRSSADVGQTQICTEAEKAACTTTAVQLADANIACTRSKGTDQACLVAAQLKNYIIAQGCFVCFTP
jgi:hypothetical protein